jgi:hypothetical protein
MQLIVPPDRGLTFPANNTRIRSVVGCFDPKGGETPTNMENPEAKQSPPLVKMTGEWRMLSGAYDKVPADERSYFGMLFEDFDLAPQRVFVHELTVAKTRFGLQAIHFPKVLLLYSQRSQLTIGVHNIELLRCLLEFGKKVLTFEFRRVRFDISKCPRVASERWSAFYEENGCQ